MRTYSRNKGDAKERWHETVERVVNGTYRMQQEHYLALGIPWNAEESLVEAEDMYDRIFHMKFLPPGR